MEPVVLALERRFGDKVDFIIVDVDTEKSLVQEYQINTIPSFLIIDSSGSVSETAVGSFSEKELEVKIRRVLE